VRVPILTGRGVSVSVSVALLFPGTGSFRPPSVATVAVFTSVPVAEIAIRHVAVYVAVAPTGRLAVSLMSPDPVAAQVPPPAPAQVHRAPGQAEGNVSTTLTLGASEGPALLVARGFVPATGAARTRPDVPPPQSGEVVVVARLRVSEPARTAGDLPPGQVLSLNAGVLAPALGYRVVDGYGELVSEQPAPSDAPVPTEAPTLTPGPHLSYAVQWLLFALMAVGGWVLLARREVQARRGGRAPDGVSRLSA